MQILEYTHLLDLADECEDPYMRVAYVCKFILFCYHFFFLCA